VRHPPQELERFVEAIDAALLEPASIIVIGGAAAALAYGATSMAALPIVNGSSSRRLVDPSFPAHVSPPEG
jgi:hypothetical protein